MSSAKLPLPHVSSTQISEELLTKRTVSILPKQCALETKFVEGSNMLLIYYCILLRNTLVAGIESLTDPRHRVS